MLKWFMIPPVMAVLLFSGLADVSAMGSALSKPAYRDILRPDIWSGVRGYMAPGDQDSLKKDHWRLYQLDADDCAGGTGNVACRGGYIVHAETIHDLVTGVKAGAGLLDITAAAAARGVTPPQFMPPAQGGGKRVQPNQIYGAGLPDGSIAIFVGRVADDQPNGPGDWLVLCRRSDAVYRQTHLGNVSPDTLNAIATALCQKR